MAPPTTHVSGTVTSDIEYRFTTSGIAVCRFRLAQTSRQWDPATQTWRDGNPITYICTAWRDLARNATESLTRGVTVLATGRITETKDSSIYLSLDDLGISLRQRIAYTETSLPSPAAAAPITVPEAPRPAPPRTAPTALNQPGRPPAWWEQQRSSGWYSTTTATHNGTSPHVDI
ncbi:single-stranded DNA-binding protein [Streptomyces noboritoensis]|uniref:Single-stranded DNA-binding protein n=1 Tax=Streptomyces noboritoensis TaxID=67337 RepID=A0ABV6TCC4_9ACTN